MAYDIPSSPHFDVGASATFGESPVRDHQRVVLGYLQGEDRMDFHGENSTATPMKTIFDD